ncbi:hypothetical protein ACFL0T_00165 [Candidatus Omnitrophota bacterium]
MEKKKLEQTIVIILVPVFIISLIITFFGKTGFKKPFVKKPKIEEEIREDESIDKLPSPKDFPLIKYEGTGKDPLRDLYLLHLSRIKTPTKTNRPKRPLPQLKIEGLIWNSDMPQAIVGGKVINIGDSILDAKVVGISKEGITLEYYEEVVLVPRK